MKLHLPLSLRFVLLAVFSMATFAHARLIMVNPLDKKELASGTWKEDLLIIVYEKAALKIQKGARLTGAVNNFSIYGELTNVGGHIG